MAGMAGGQVQQGQQMTPDDRPNMVIIYFCAFQLTSTTWDWIVSVLDADNIASTARHQNKKKTIQNKFYFQGMPGTFDMSGNMAGAGAPGGIQQQPMITPGQQQQAFARQQQQQQLLGTEISVFKRSKVVL